MSDSLGNKDINNAEITKKLDKLHEILKSLGRVAVCVSGGTDSAMLLIESVKTLGIEGVLPVTAETDFFTGSELNLCHELCNELGMRLCVTRVQLLEDDDIMKNNAERCYYCKRRMMKAMEQAANKHGFDQLVDGSNIDDQSDYRPGSRAAVEYGVVSPLMLAGITKEDICTVLKMRGFAKYIQPANACLATRIAMGERISIKRLRDVCAMENCLHAAGFDLVRVRVSGKKAVIEVAQDRVSELYSIEGWIVEELKQFGFDEVCIDPNGYRKSGSMFLKK